MPVGNPCGEITDLVCEEDGEIESVGVDTLPGQPERGVRT